MNFNSRGLTILELIVSLAISLFVLMAALSATNLALAVSRDSDRRQDLINDFGLLGDYFAPEIPSGGGAGLPPQAAYMVEDNCGARANFPNCKQSDRLTMANVAEAPLCSIKTYNAFTGVGSMTVSSPLPCCLTSQNLLHKQVMIVSGDSFSQRWVSSTNTSSCTFTSQPGPMALNDAFSAATVWAGSAITPLALNTYYLDPNGDFLKKYAYDDQGSNASSGRADILADRVLDFQVAFGFDFSPADGLLTDSGSTSDEWLYNAVGDSRTSPFFINAAPSTFRMISIGLIIGTPTSSYPGLKSAKILNGPSRSRSGYVLQAGQFKFGIRSLYLFD